MSKDLEQSAASQKPSDIARRHAVKTLAVIFAGSLSARSLAAALTQPSGTGSTDEQNGLAFNPQDYKLVKVIAELIIPETETPGAIAAKVHDFMDTQVAQCFTKLERTEFLQQLRQIDHTTTQRYKRRFIDCSEQQQIDLLQNMELAQNGFTEKDKAFFKQFKALTLLGYYTSEVGATQELAYLPIPGAYIGSYPFSKIGKAWSL